MNLSSNACLWLLAGGALQDSYSTAPAAAAGRHAPKQAPGRTAAAAGAFKAVPESEAEAEKGAQVSVAAGFSSKGLGTISELPPVTAAPPGPAGGGNRPRGLPPKHEEFAAVDLDGPQSHTAAGAAAGEGGDFTADGEDVLADKNVDDHQWVEWLVWSLSAQRSPCAAGEATYNQSTSAATQGQLSSLPHPISVRHASIGAEAADRLPGAPLKEAVVLQEGCAAAAAVADAATAARGSTGSFASAAAFLEAAHNSKISRLGATAAVCGADGWGEVSERGACGWESAAVGLGNGLAGNLPSGQEDKSLNLGLSANPFATGNEGVDMFGAVSLSIQKGMHKMLNIYVSKNEE